MIQLTLATLSQGGISVPKDFVVKMHADDLNIPSITILTLLTTKTRTKLDLQGSRSKGLGQT